MCQLNILIPTDIDTDTHPPLQFIPCFFVGNSAVHTVNTGIKYDLSCLQKSAHCSDIKIVSSVPPSTMNEREHFKVSKKDT